MENRICVYTCITGDYDNLQSIEKEEGIDYLCFTNNPKLKSDCWSIVNIEDDKELSDVGLSRKIKMIGHPVIAEQYDISIWVDGAIQIRGSVKSFLKDVCGLDRYNIACFRHRMRNCVYEEALACIVQRKADKKDILYLLDFLEQERFPRNCGLAECTVLVRRHNSAEVKQMMSLWFELYSKYVKRDQLTFPYCIYKLGIEVCWIESNVFDNPWFFWRAHKQLKETATCRIIYGDYKNIYKDYYVDQEMIFNGQTVRLGFNIPINCKKISINIGKHFGRVLKDFKINAEDVDISFFPGISILNYKVFDYDDMVIFLKGDFSEKQEICCFFEMPKLKDVEIQKLAEGLVEQYYYSKIVNENKIIALDHISEDLVRKLGDAKKYDHLQSSPLFWKIKPLCERQDLKAKIIRKLILKFVD
ncbi:glycosyltransferase domain-containing protein [Lachnospiraceae bacterium 62-26]